MGEKWKQMFVIIDNELIYTDYEISTYGNIRNSKGLALRPAEDKNGYMLVGIRINHSFSKSFLLHRLVALNFIQVHDMYKNQVNHIDGNKKNNNVENLEWVDNRENQIHAIKNGLINHSKGIDRYNVRYDESTIHSVCKMMEDGLSNKHIRKTIDIDKNTLKDIRRQKSWKSISCGYNIPRNSPRIYSDEFIKKGILIGEIWL